MPNIRDLTLENPFGRLTVIKEGGRASDGKVKWICQCECGTELEVVGRSLVAGLTKSCGCLQREAAQQTGLSNTTHGMKQTPEYRTWQSMLNRCRNPNVDSFENYGGRGITVCNRWVDSFDAFLEDMGVRPQGTSIDRIDPNGNYDTGNCRWATTDEQATNKRDSLYLEVDGIRMHAKKWAAIAGISVQVIYKRKSAGWSDKDTLSKPNRRQKWWETIGNLEM